MAQTIDIKVLIDAAESVKTIKEARQALKDLRSAALQVEEGSESFTQIQQAAGALQDKVKDLQATTKFFADDLRTLSGLKGVAEGIAGGFALAQGAMTLFGSQNESLEKSLLKLNAVMAILNGLTAVGNVLQAESSAVLLIQQGVRNGLTAVVGRQAVAEAAEAVAAGTATVAQRALNAAMNANPIGILITLILSGVAALTLWTDTTEEATKQAEALRKEEEAAAKQREEENVRIGEQAGGFLKLAFALKATNAGSKERKVLIDEINSTYGTTFKNLKDEEKFQSQLNLSVKEYIALQVLKQRQAQKDKESKAAIGELIKAQDRLNAVEKEYAGMSEKQIEDYDLKKYGVSNYSTAITKYTFELNQAQKKAEEYTISANDLQKEIDKLTLSGKKYEVQTNNNTNSTNNNTKSINDNDKSINNLIKSYEDLTALTKEYNLESTTIYLERIKTTLQEEVSLRELNFSQTIKKLEDKSAQVIKKVIDEEVAVLKTQKAYAQKKGESEEAYTKRLEGIINERFKNDKNYADKAKIIEDNKLALAKNIEEKKQKFITETNEFILEQQEKQLQAAKKVAEEILSPAQFTIFFQAAQRVLNQNQNIIKAEEVSLENFNDTLLDLNKAILFNAGAIGQKLMMDLLKSSKKQNSALLDILQNGGQEITQTLNDLQKDSYVKQTKIITDLLNLSTEYQKANIDDTQLFILKIGAFYQDKFNLIKQVEEEVKRSSGIEKSFFEATEEQIQKEVLLLKEKSAIRAEDFKSTEEYEKALRSMAIERLAFTIEDNEKLSEVLQKRFDTLIKAEENNYAQSLSNLLESNRTKKITDEQYLKGLEDLQKSHNDNILNIEVAYGKKSFEEVANRRRAIIEEQKAENKEKEDLQKEAANKEIELRKKVVAEYLSVEQELQSALFELFQRTQQERERTAQATYDNEIARIEAAEKKYEDSLANRTAAEQADLDVKAGFAEQRQNAEKRLNDEKNRIAQKAFTAQKVNDLSTITIQTAVAIAKTIAELGGVGAITPPGIALIAAVAAQGAIQASLVASQQFVPQYATGGLVSGPGTGTSDSVLVRVSNGESIINARSTKKYQPILSAINVDGGGKSFAPGFANGGMVDMTTYSSKDNMTEIKELLLQINSRPIETYVKQTVVENASQKSDRLKRRTTFG